MGMRVFVILFLIPLILSIGLAPALPFADAFENTGTCNANQIIGGET